MEKRYVLKSWVQKLLMIIMVVCFVVVASDCDNMMVFIVSKTIAFIITIGCVYLLNTQGDPDNLK